MNEPSIRPFEKKIYLSSPTMHGEELQYMKEAFDTNWMSTVGQNINEVERLICEKIGCKNRKQRFCYQESYFISFRHMLLLSCKSVPPVFFCSLLKMGLQEYGLQLPFPRLAHCIFSNHILFHT